MFIREMKVSDYFENAPTGASNKELFQIQELRNAINSFPDVDQQIEYIEVRRQQKATKNFDERFFNIAKDAYFEEKYKRSYSGVRNTHQNTLETVDIEAVKSKQSQKNEGDWLSEHNFDGASKTVSFVTTNISILWKVVLISFIVFAVINVGVFIFGLVTSAGGSSPFQICGGAGQAYIASGSSLMKEKDGYKIPIDHSLATKEMGKTYTGTGYTGDDANRGKGYLTSEDCKFPGTDKFGEENYSIAARWEYAGYETATNKWPGWNKNFGGKNPTTDGISKITSVAGGAAYQKWITTQRVLVYNPDNGQSVVCIVGNGEHNANWGGSPLGAVAGISYKAQQALGFSNPSSSDSKYKGNCMVDIQFEMWWVPENTPLGPASGLTVGSSDCGSGGNVSGGNSSIADAAVSISEETVGEATPNTGLNNGNGTDLYIAAHGAVLPGDALYQSCDRSAATAIRWSGADDTFPAGSTGVQLAYVLKATDKWQKVSITSEKDLKPGDIMIKQGAGHIAIYAGNDAVRKKYPNSDGTIVSGSIGSRGLPGSPFNLSNRGPSVGTVYPALLQYNVFRNIKQETNSKWKNISIKV